MRGRGAAAGAIILLTGTLAGCHPEKGEKGERAPADGPNVLLISLDTTRADRIGCYGYTAAQTPTIDALAAEGVRFEQAFADVPITLPSHASLLTGLHPPSHGIHINVHGVLGPDVPMLPEAFKARGYRTGAFVASWILDSMFGLDRGFDHYDDRIGGDRDISGEIKERRADEVCELALAWLDEAPEMPFFAWVHFYDPHHPYDPPKAYRDRFDEPYDGEIAFTDAAIGRFVEWLEAHGLKERTVIVVTSDHGESFGEHDEPQHGFFIYDTTMRVPLIFSYPGVLPPGCVVASGARLVDVAPTILDVLGWPPIEGVEGKSLVPACRTAQAGFLPAYGESEYPRLGFGWAPLRSLTTRRWKYIQAPRAELYDRIADPEELRNVIGEHPETARAMRAQLVEMVAHMNPRVADAPALDDKALETLASLGYVGGTAALDERTPDASRRDPKDMISFYRKLVHARALAQMERHDEVVGLLEPLVRQDPTAGELQSTLGKAYLALGRVEDAEKAYEASTRGCPGDPAKWCGLCDALRAAGKWDKAIHCYQRVLDMSPKFGQAHCRLTLTYIKLKDLPRAYDYALRFLEISSRSANALSNMAHVLVLLHRTGEAVAHFKEALERDPACGPVHRALWRALLYDGRPREALDALRVARTILPKDPMLTRELAWLLATSARADLRDGKEALQLALTCCGPDSTDAKCLDVLAAAYAEIGAFPQAVEIARQAATLADRDNNTGLQAKIAHRLQLYESGQAYRK